LVLLFHTWGTIFRVHDPLGLPVSTLDADHVSGFSFCRHPLRPGPLNLADLTLYTPRPSFSTPSPFPSFLSPADFLARQAKPPPTLEPPCSRHPTQSVRLLLHLRVFKTRIYGHWCPVFFLFILLLIFSSLFLRLLNEFPFFHPFVTSFFGILYPQPQFYVHCFFISFLTLCSRTHIVFAPHQGGTYFLNLPCPLSCTGRTWRVCKPSIQF